MNWPTIILMLVFVAGALWLVTGGLWWLLRLIGRNTGLGEKVDHSFDTEGELDAPDYLKFKEQHRDSVHRSSHGF